MAVTSNAPDLNRGRMVVIQSGYAASGDTGAPIQVPPRCKKISVQAFGTFAGGQSEQVQGSNDGGTTWADLGVTAFTAAAMRDVPVFPDLLRITSTAGAGSAVTMAICIYFD